VLLAVCSDHGTLSEDTYGIFAMVLIV